MRVSSVVIGSSVALFLLSTVSFADPTQPAGTAAAAPANDPDEIVCKLTAAPTGTRLGGGRECHTQRDWNVHEKEAQKVTQDKQIRSLQACLHVSCLQ